jgi:3-deoxy-D-manno-octulosonic-acid transferase
MAAAAVALFYRLVLQRLPLSEEGRKVVVERLGRWPRRLDESKGALVWIHAASVGEVGVAGPLIAGLRERFPALRLLLTCNTTAGREAAEKLPADEVHYFPLDHRPIMRALLARLRPSLAIFVETELWPTLLGELARSRVPALVVNARISDRSFPRYRKVVWVLRPVLASLSMVCARDRTSMERLVELGVAHEKVSITGDIKFDALTAEVVTATEDLLSPLSEGRPVLLAASTRDGEEEKLLDAFLSVRSLRPDTGLLLAPRHAQRSAKVVDLARGRGLRTATLSSCRREPWDVLVLDTVGRLRAFMKGALGAFVGGSLVDVGGHNLLEPAAFGLPISCGPHLANVSEQAAALREAGALTVVNDGDELAGVWSGWLKNPGDASCRGRAGKTFLERNMGALKATTDAIDPWLRGLGEGR